MISIKFNKIMSIIIILQGTYLGGSGNGNSLFQGFDPLPTLRVPFDTLLRHSISADQP